MLCELPNPGGHPCPTLGPPRGSSPGLPSLDLLRKSMSPAGCQPLRRSSTPAPTLPLVFKSTLSKNQLGELGFTAQPSWPHSAGSVRPPPLLPASRQDFTSQTSSDVWFPRHSRKGHPTTQLTHPFLYNYFGKFFLKPNLEASSCGAIPSRLGKGPGIKRVTKEMLEMGGRGG